jgi:hypoxanthine phosphoribosyltransferase
MSELRLLVSPQEISDVVERLAAEIQRDYQGKTPVLLGALKGSFVFMADLVRHLNIPLEVEFVMLSSYGRGRKESSGEVKLVRGLCAPTRDRDILVIEDIVDTGITLSFLLNYLQRKRPASVKVCALFDKATCRKVSVPIDYLGFKIPDEFVVGYGLDYDEKYRYLPGLYALKGIEPGP